MYHDICELNGSNSWYFNMDSTFVTHNVSHNVSDKSRWMPLLTFLDKDKEYAKDKNIHNLRFLERYRNN